MGGTLGPALFALQQQMQQQPQQQQTPQAPPVQPGTTDDPLTNAMVSSMQTGQQQFNQDVARRADLAKQLQQLQGQQAQLQPPKTGYEPKFQPMNSVGHVLGDIGKGALLGLSATAPGRAVSEAIYGPGERRYQTQAGSLANQIAEIQRQMGSESEAMQAASGMASKPMAAAARYQVGVMNNQTRQLHDRAMEGLKSQLMDLQAKVAAGKLKAEEARTQAEILIGRGHDQALQSVAGTYSDQRDRAEQMKVEDDVWKSDITGLKTAFGSLFGAEPPPTMRATPPPGPKAAGSKVQAKPNVNKPGGVVKWGRDAQGNPVRVQ